MPLFKLSCPHCQADCPVSDPAELRETHCPVCGRPVSATDRPLEDGTVDPVAASSGPASASPAAAFPVVAGYQLLGELGRGVMGVVYQARQVKLDRLVALKMILAGAHAGEQDLARFKVEAEAVARLQHPNIIQIHEIGELEMSPGRPQPYFSLEYVAGGSLAQQLDGTPWPAPQAAPLVETLARAMHYAHEHDIVHRDLKPANVLLQRAEGRGPRADLQSALPKITDFGLAKKLDQAASQTQSGAIVGTPSYMAPEQAGGKTHAIGPATDVYALGAILYELLTGRPPFKAETPLDTVLQVLAEEPVSPRRLQPKVPRDLETICLKCLHKEPRKRYATAQDLAEDLRRFQAGEPVRARPTPLVERAVKWARRRPAVAALSAAVVLITAVGFGLVTWLWWEAADHADREHAARRQAEAAERSEKRQKQTAEMQRRRAVKNLRKAREAVQQMLVRVSEDKERLKYEPHMELVRRKLLKDALRYYQTFLEEEPDDPEVQLETAHAYEQVAKIQHLLHQDAAAEKAYRAALRLLGKLAEAFPRVPSYRQDLAFAYNNLGILFQERARPAAAEKAYRAALKLHRQLVHDLPRDPEHRENLANHHMNLGHLLQHTGRLPEAEQAFQAALRLRQQLVKDFPTEPLYRAGLAHHFDSMGIAWAHAGRTREAKQTSRQAVAAWQQLVRDHPREPDYRQGLARAYSNLGTLLLDREHWPEKERVGRQALQVHAQLARDFPRVPEYRSLLAGNYNGLGDVLCRVGHLPEAEEAFQQALKLREQLLAEFPTLPAYHSALGSVLNNLANFLNRQGQHPKARRLVERAIQHQQLALQAYPLHPEYRLFLRNHYAVLAQVLIDAREPAEAVKAYAQAIALLEKLAAQFPTAAGYRETLADLNAQQGRLLAGLAQPREAARAYRQAVAWQKKRVAERSHQPLLRHELATYYDRLGSCLSDARQPRAAEQAFRLELEQLQQLEKDFARLPAYQSDRGGALHNLAMVLKEQGRLAEARPLLEQAVRYQQQACKADPKNPTMSLYLRRHLFVLSDVLVRQQAHARAVEVAAEFARLFAEDWKMCYCAAGFLARCQPLAEKDSTLPEAKRTALAREYGDRAMALLQTAATKGFKEVGYLKNDPDFKPLQSRPAFQKLVTTLEERLKAEKK